MPVRQKKAPLAQPVAPVAPPEPPPAPVQEPETKATRELIYDHLEIDEYSSTAPKGPVDPEWCKTALGWETESEFKKRKCEEVPGSKPDNWKFDDVFHCKNISGEKVRCNNNAHNRSFDQGWCDSLKHTVLYGQWAGPFTIPGETVNGETIRISKYGEVLSGQHQMTGCVLADEQLAKDRADGVDNPTKPKYPTWRTQGHVFIETIVIKGMSEDPRVLMTVDYVKPRTAGDVFYTSSVFKSCTAPERKELCKMLASAVDFLWTRTDARGYKTHPEVVGFLERHKTLLKTTLHIFEENKTREGKGRGISKLRLSPGQCSAIGYIQGSSGPKTDGDVYRNEEPAPSERGLDWSMWGKAESFWTLLGSGKDFAPVRNALYHLIDSEILSEDNQGMGGRAEEKLAILCEAWGRWKEHTGTGDVFDDGDLAEDGILSLVYSELDDEGNALPEGQIKLVNKADFLGIDSPVIAGKAASKKDDKMPPPPSREEIERATEEARKRRQQPLK